MRSEDKILVEIRTSDFTPSAKPLVFVSMWSDRFINPTTRLPEIAHSFEDLHRIIGGIVKCETEKYKNMVRRSPADLVRQVLTESVDVAVRLCAEGQDPTCGEAYERAWQALSEKTRLPPRTRVAPRGPRKRPA